MRINILKLDNIIPQIFNKAVLFIRKCKVGNNLRVNGFLFIRGKGKIEIGDNVMINSSRASNPIGGDIRTIIYAKDNSLIRIGNGVGISNSAIVAMNEIIIEDDVFIGGDCKIYDHDFHSIRYEERMSEFDTGVQYAPVRICKGAFIGGHTIILKGITIGEKSVIGAGSVVTKDIPEGEIWAGNPAKCIKKV